MEESPDSPRKPYAPDATRTVNIYFLPFSSLFSLQNLRVAWLTHSFHCCAFKFPQRHDPYRHAQRIKYLADLHKKCLNEKLISDTNSNTENVDVGGNAVSWISWILFLFWFAGRSAMWEYIKRTEWMISKINILSIKTPLTCVQQETERNNTLAGNRTNERNKRFIDDDSDEVFFK